MATGRKWSSDDSDNIREEADTDMEQTATVITVKEVKTVGINSLMTKETLQRARGTKEFQIRTTCRGKEIITGVKSVTQNGECSGYEFFKVVSDELSKLEFVGDGINRQSNWKRGEHIGSGAFGKVYEVKDSFLHRNLAVKQVIGCQQDSDKEKAALLKELQILKGLSHPRIVQFYGFCEADDVLSLFMERIKGGSLDKYLKYESKKPLGSSSIRYILKQMLEGVSYLHSKRILHRDIKSDNILMDEHLHIKLADFGVSKVFQEISKATTKQVGTTRWMAPEMFYQSNDYSYEVDIWAIGCTVTEMLTRKRPFYNLKEEHQVLFKLMSPDPSPAYDVPETCPPNLREFLNEVFQKDGSKRPSARDLLLGNPFVTEDDCDETLMKKEKLPAKRKSQKLMPEDEQAIKRHWVWLIEELDATHIISDLISVGVFDVEDKWQILRHASRKKRTEIMLQKLVSAGPGPAFKLFLDVLEKNHRHIADKLRE
ncbi:unnamed protein product [Lymnaea stagnalis]|uniref:Protein kinase domain-containing protein n=1 Tax=Lymnaea stagnalis TaxID=6523 RepID=A0AAV2HKF7_LYMST